MKFKKLRTWREGCLPDKKAIFVIGDLHGEYKLLDKLFREINKKIFKLPKLVKKEIIFIGDYIDRGINSKKTISNLINLKKKYLRYKYINIHFLCGNHDEFFSKLISTNGIIQEPQNNLFKNDNVYKLMKSSCNNLYITGLKAWYNIGGGKTTIRDYNPNISEDFEKLINYDEEQNKFSELNFLLKKLKDKIPLSHKNFFKNIVKNYFLILGQYLFVHAGVIPNKKLSSQGIGKNYKKINEYDFIKLLMIRDPFLWTEKLSHCPFYVVHGHTPSEILKNKIVVADGKKSFRLCLDTNVYNKQGSLTCFFKYNKQNEFISVLKKNINIKINY